MGVNRLQDNKVLSSEVQDVPKYTNMGDKRRAVSTLCGIKKNYCRLLDLIKNKFGTSQNFEIKQAHK